MGARKGFTLLEVLLALGLLAVVVLAFTALQVTSLRGGRQGRELQAVVREMENFMERLRQDPQGIPTLCNGALTLAGKGAPAPPPPAPWRKTAAWPALPREMRGPTGWSWRWGASGWKRWCIGHEKARVFPLGTPVGLGPLGKPLPGGLGPGELQRHP